jgi:hypothetical protein
MNDVITIRMAFCLGSYANYGKQQTMYRSNQHTIYPSSLMSALRPFFSIVARNTPKCLLPYAIIPTSSRTLCGYGVIDHKQDDSVMTKTDLFEYK